MRGWARAFTTLIGAAAAGVLVWFVPHFDRWSTGGYFEAMAVFALAGLILGVAQLRGREGNPVALFLIVFVPVLLAVGWVALAAQPRSSWLRDHVVSWSGDIGIGHVVHNLGEHVAVLVFALGLVFGLMFEPAMIRRRRRTRPAVPTAPIAPPPPVIPEPVPEPAPVAVEEPTVVAATGADTVVVHPAEPAEQTVVTTANQETAVVEPAGASETEPEPPVSQPPVSQPPDNAER